MPPLESKIFGTCSCIAFAASQFPQLLIDQPEQGAVSLWFLTMWLVADITDVIGCILIDAMATQVALAIIWLLSTLLLIHRHRRSSTTVFTPLDEQGREHEQGHEHGHEHGHERAPEDPVSTTVALGRTFRLWGRRRDSTPLTPLTPVFFAQLIDPVLCRSGHHHHHHHHQQQQQQQQRRRRRTHLMLPTRRRHHIGWALGWVTTIFYSSARIPQVVLNCQRGTTEGLSTLMFTLTVLGNICYLCSVLFNDASWSAILKVLPWVVDASLCILIDIVVIFQCVSKHYS